MTQRRALRALSLAVVPLLALGAAEAFHTALRSSSPAEDERLTTSPTELRLTYTERVDPRLARVELLAAGSVPVRLDTLRAGGAPQVIVTRILDTLPAGEFTVAWQVVGLDGHPVRGRFAFVVDPPGAVEVPAMDEGTVAVPDPDASVAPVVEAESPDVLSPSYVATRWLTFASILTIIGAVAFRTLVLGTVRRRSNVPSSGAVDEAALRAARLGRGAAAFLLLAAGMRLLLQTRALDMDGGGSGMMGVILLNTPWGWGWLLQVAAAVLALSALHRAAGSPQRGWPVAVVAALVLAFTPALSGHAAAVESVGGLAIAVDGVHVLAASVWIGTLLALVAAGVPAALRSGGGGATIAEFVSVFSPLALVFAAVLVGTGAFSAVLHLEAVNQLWTTGYGRTLLLKVAIVAVVAAVGAYNWRVTRPRLDVTGPESLRRPASLELLAAAVVLIVTAVLVATPTP